MSENIPSINNTRQNYSVYHYIHDKERQEILIFEKKKPANVHVKLNNTISKSINY